MFLCPAIYLLFIYYCSQRKVLFLLQSKRHISALFYYHTFVTAVVVFLALESLSFTHITPTCDIFQTIEYRSESGDM